MVRQYAQTELATFPLPAGVESHLIESREQWLALRKQLNDVTASVTGALFGAHPFETIAGLHAAKSGIEMPEVDPNAAPIRRGNALESVVAGEIGKLHPEWSIVKAREYLRDPKLRLGATPDFYILGDPRGLGVLQAKTVGSYKFKREWGDEGLTPPFWISLQTATEMMLRNAAFGVIGVLVIGDFAFDAHEIEVPRHVGAEKRITEAVKTFWGNLEAGVVPQIDYERDAGLISLMWPTEVDGKVIDLRADNRIGELLEARDKASQALKILNDEKSAIETEIKVKLGDAERAIVEGWRVSLKLQHRKEFTAKATSFRVLRSARET